jgi:hypothetical protein
MGTAGSLGDSFRISPANVDAMEEIGEGGITF